MRYRMLFLPLVGMCLLVGCSERSPEDAGADQTADVGHPAVEKGMRPGQGVGIEEAGPGELWVLKNRVPLVDEPADFGDQEDFKKHLVTPLQRGTTVEVLQNKGDGWLRVRTRSPGQEGDSEEGWISIANILRADKASAEGQGGS